MLIIREMQIKAKMRYHLIPVKMPIIKKPTNNKCWQEYGKETNPCILLVGCKLVELLRRHSTKYTQKPKTELPYHPAMSLLVDRQFMVQYISEE